MDNNENYGYNQSQSRADSFSQQSRDLREMHESISTYNGFTTPPQQSFDSEEMRGTIQKILADNIGEYVVVEFLIGTCSLVRKQGILYFVGTSYVTLYDETIRNFIVCDIFSIKFVYFYFPGERPRFNFNVLNANARMNSYNNMNNANNNNSANMNGMNNMGNMNCNPNTHNMNNFNNMNNISNTNGMC